ncbi:MAG TPA: response regulator [Bryobacteraceae bacterium]|nr:response regulator [Bryobacteraceae bacterium]
MDSLADLKAEEARAAVVERIRRSGLPSDDVLTGFCRTAGAVFGTPIAFFSLVTSKEILFIGREGLRVSRMPREPGLCLAAIGEGTCRNLRDASQELGCAHNRLVENEPGIRFYAGVPIRVDGYSVGTIAVADTAPRRATEREIAALAELARLAATELARNLSSADDAIERLRRAMHDEVGCWLSYGLSHEYTNALTGAMALCETLERSPPTTAPALLIKLEEAHSRMAELTRSFIEFQEGVPHSAAPLPINHVVDTAATLMQYVLGRNVEVTVELNRTQSGVQVEARGLHFPLALLLVRARNAMEGSGTLAIATEILSLADGLQTDLVDLPAGDYVTIAVNDTGRAPAAAEVQALSGWLELPVNPESDAIRLWFVQDAVSRLGGQLDLAPGPGGGSSLTVYLPMLAPVPRERSHETKHLLVVEDAAILAEALQSALSRSGYRVTISSRGDEAFTSLPDAAGIDLLIADVLLPGMSGIDLARRLRETNPGLPVVLISGQTEQSNFEPDEMLIGAVFLQKPFSMEVLLRAVTGLLGSRD